MPAFANLRRQLSVAELLFIAFIVIYPLFVNPFFAPVFGLPKLILLIIVAVVLAAIWSLQAIKAGRIELRVPKIALPGAAFLLVALLSSLQSVHPATSFLGQYGRWEGFITILSYTVVFLSAYSIASRKEALGVLFAGVLASTALVSAVAVIEHLWTNPFLLVAKIYCSAGFGQPNAFEVGRSMATFGSATFLAAYLAIVLPAIFAAILAKERPILPKIVLYFVFALGLVALVLTFARAAWLGAALGFFLVFVTGDKDLKLLKSLVLLVVILAVAVAAVQALGGPYTPLSRAVSLFKLESSSLTRVQMWQASLPLVPESPILGSGPDTFKFVFGKYKPEGWVEHLSDPLVDRAHNDSLQTVVTFGFLGLVAYLWLFTAFFWIGIKKLRQEPDPYLKWVLTGALGGALAYFVHLQFNFSHFSVSPYLWLFMGIASAVSFKSTRKEISLSLSNRQKTITCALVAVLTATLACLAGLALAADSHFYNGRDLEAKGNLSEALLSYRRASTLSRLENTYRLALAESYFKLAKQAKPAQRARLLRSGTEEFETAARLNPVDEQVHFRAGAAYLAAGRREQARQGQVELLQATINKHHLGLSLNPVMVDAHIDIGVAHALLNDIDSAISAWLDALEIDPENDWAYFNLGWAYEQKRDLLRAKESYHRAYRLNPNMPEAKAGYERLANIVNSL